MTNRDPNRTQTFHSSGVQDVRAPICWAVRCAFFLPGAALGTTRCCQQALCSKIDMAVEGHPASLAVALVLLRFCLGWCQLNYYAITMPPVNLVPCAIEMRFALMECLGRTRRREGASPFASFHVFLVTGPGVHHEEWLRYPQYRSLA